MPARDHHQTPYDEGTLTKLQIYKSYVEAWLQVFLHSPKFEGKPLQVFDFFSGPGQDSSGTPGSPLIVLNELSNQRELIGTRCSHRF